MLNGGSSQLLELTLLSARDLAHVSKSMKAFAVVWIDPARKLETRPDGKNQNNNPTWNEKFVFKLDPSSSAVNVEIYAAKSRRSDVVPVGAVSVLVASLFPSDDPSDRRRTGSRKTRFLTLQLRRPSGRPQGVVDIGVAVLDGTRRSMPLSAGGSELSSSVAVADSVNHRQYYFKSKLRRSKSERSISEVYLLKPAATETDESSAADGGGGGGTAAATARGSVSSSDVGPSPSVVAAEIAMAAAAAAAAAKNKKKKAAAAAETESSILEEWVEEDDDDTVEGLRTKIERWRSEIHPLYQNLNTNNNNNNAMAVRRSTYRRNESGEMTAAAAAAATPSKKGHRRGGSSGLFSCFGTAYGCEFSITCGGGGGKKRSNGGGSSDDEDDEGPVCRSELHYGDQYV